MLRLARKFGIDVTVMPDGSATLKASNSGRVPESVSNPWDEVL